MDEDYRCREYIDFGKHHEEPADVKLMRQLDSLDDEDLAAVVDLLVCQSTPPKKED